MECVTDNVHLITRRHHHGVFVSRFNVYHVHQITVNDMSQQLHEIFIGQMKHFKITISLWFYEGTQRNG